MRQLVTQTPMFNLDPGEAEQLGVAAVRVEVRVQWLEVVMVSRPGQLL